MVLNGVVLKSAGLFIKKIYIFQYLQAYFETYWFLSLICL